MALRVSGFFAGIGGLEEGLRRAGHEAVQLCESDLVARAVLAKRFPDVTVDQDIRKLTRVATSEVWTAGFPCQDLSQAGLTKGLRGSSSGLVKEVFRLLGKSHRKPTWLVLENVPFMLKLHRGRAIRSIVGKLEEMRWRWAYRTVDSRAFGLAQRRRRVILLASRHEDPREVLFADNVDDWDLELPTKGRSYGFYWTEGNTGIGWAIDAVPTLKGGSALSIPSPPAVWMPARHLFGTPTIEDAERLQGFPGGWTKPAKTETNGQRQRWRLVGNAVSVPVARWLGSRLEAPADAVVDCDTPLQASDTWPDAAWGEKGARWQVSASEAPIDRKLVKLADALCDELRPLSHRASSGFLSRLEKSDLRTSAQFRDQLRAYAAKRKRVERLA